MTKEAYWHNWVVRTAVTWKDIEIIVEKTGIDFIDAGYKRIIEDLLEMNKHLALLNLDQVDLKVVKKHTESFERIVEFAKDFYEEEEALLTKHELPEAEMQKKDHKKVQTLLYGTLLDFKSGKIQAANDFASLIIKSILRHIHVFDVRTWELENWKKSIVRSKSFSDFEEIMRVMGISRFDGEHREFIHRAISLKREKYIEDVEQKLGELHGYAEKHFAQEEKFIKSFFEDAIEKVLKGQDETLELISSLQNKVRSGMEKSPVEISTQIILKWIAHVNQGNYETICLDTCGERIFKNIGGVEDVSFLIQKTGVSSIDSRYDALLSRIFEIDGLMGERSEKEGVLERNDLVESYFDDLQEMAKDLFAIESEVYKFDSVSLITRRSGYGSLSDEQKKILRLVSYYHASFQEERIMITPEIKSRLLSLLIFHHNNLDMPPQSEGQEGIMQ